MNEEELPKPPVHLNTDGGANITGDVATGGGDFVGRDQYQFSTNIQQFIRNSAEWQDAIWRGLTRHWPALAALFVLEIALFALFNHYKDLYLIPYGVWIVAAGLLFATTLTWYLYWRSQWKAKHVFVTVPVSVLFATLVGWQAWQVTFPDQFDPAVYGIAVAELGEGSSYFRTGRAREISNQVYEHLLASIEQEVAEPQKTDEGDIKVLRIGVIPDSATAQWYGKKIRADIVLWGQILTSRADSATIRFEILETPDRAVNPDFPLVMPVTLKSTDLVAAELDLTSDPVLLKEVISQQTKIVARSALGMRDYIQREYRGAAINFEGAIQAIDTESQVSSSPEGLSLIYFYIGRAYQGMGQVELGQEWLIKAMQKNPTEPVIPLTLGLGYGSLGRIEERDEQLDLAMTLLNTWIEDNPKDATALFDRGVIRQIHGEYDYSILDFETALQYDPNYYIAYIALGQSAAKIGKIDKAVETIKKGIELANERGVNDSWARFNLALIYEDAGQTEPARKQYETIISTPQPEPWSYYYYARFLEKQGEMDAALNALQKSAQHASASGIEKGWAFSNLADFYKRHELFKQAKETYQQALSDKPEDALLHAHLGDVYFSLKDPDNARKEYERAIQLGSSIYYTYAAYGDLLYQIGDYERAAKMYEKSLELRPEDSGVLLNLASTYLSLRSPDKAIKIYTNMLAMGTKLPDTALQTARNQLQALGVETP